MLRYTLAEDPHLAIEDLSVTIPPTAENGCAKPSYALVHQVTTASKQRIASAASGITAAQLAEIRQRIALAIGLG